MLLLVRHGRTTWNAQRRLTGRSDAPLDEEGVAQALSLRGALGNLVEVRTTSLSRTQTTAALCAPELDHVVDDAFLELDYGEVEGMPVDEVPAASWRAMREDPSWRWPGGESLDDLQARVGAAMRALFETDGAGARRSDGDVLVVSHVGPIKAAVAWVLGCPPQVALRLRLDNATVTRILQGPLGPMLLTYNAPPPPTSPPR